MAKQIYREYHISSEIKFISGLGECVSAGGGGLGETSGGGLGEVVQNRTKNLWHVLRNTDADRAMIIVEQLKVHM